MDRIARTLLILLIGLPASVRSQEPAKDRKPDDARSFAGLWDGAWGGGPRGDGVVMQPVLAEAYISGKRIELSGFRGVQRLAGTWRIDERKRELTISPDPDEPGQPAPAAIRFSYRLQADDLTLTDADQVPVNLHRRHTATTPLANVQIELAIAAGFSVDGDLQVADQRKLRVGSAGETRYEQQPRTIRLQQSSLFVIQEQEWKAIALETARKTVTGGTPVVLAWRNAQPHRDWEQHALWTVQGPAAPDSEPALRTISRLVRPGTVVFILSAIENEPQP